MRLHSILYQLNVEKYVFLSSHKQETKKIFSVPIRNQNSDLQIPHFDALPLSHRDSTVGLLKSSYDTHPAYF